MVILVHTKVKDMPRHQQQRVMSTFTPIKVYNPKIAVRKRVDGTIVTTESDVYVGYVTTKEGLRIARYMNKDEAIRWHLDTGNPIKKL